jgi:hypothetical protein
MFIPSASDSSKPNVIGIFVPVKRSKFEENISVSHAANKEIFRIFVLRISLVCGNKNAKNYKIIFLVQPKRTIKKIKKLSTFFFAVKVFVQRKKWFCCLIKTEK